MWCPDALVPAAGPMQEWPVVERTWAALIGTAIWCGCLQRSSHVHAAGRQLPPGNPMQPLPRTAHHGAGFPPTSS